LATTSTGLKVYARLDTNTYQTKIKVPDAEINAVNIERDDFHGEWNYTIHPNSTFAVLNVVSGMRTRSGAAVVSGLGG
jgi:hypothetical protein